MSTESELYEDTIMLHGWPECGPGSVSIEKLYQAFKARLMREVVSRSSGYVFDVDGVRLNGAPLMEREPL